MTMYNQNVRRVVAVLDDLSEFSLDGKSIYTHPAGIREEYHIPKGVKIIKQGAFSMWKSIDKIIVPPGVEKIEPLSFTACGMKSIVLPHGVDTIGDCAFYRCPRLQKIFIPSTVTRIGRCAFFREEGKVHIEFEGSRKQWEDCISCSGWQPDPKYIQISFNCTA